ncbi:MAG: RND transporter [Leptospiraceae bacterium]|nr:hypothetical protein [Leptospiraceae bacterium]MCP5498327.1 RND transporter [Leptospiraceae bacterium]
MLSFLNRLSYSHLLLPALLLGLAPFFPEPHLLEKLRMLKNGELIKPLDIFDLFMHSAPLLLLLLKFLVSNAEKENR